MILIRNKDTGQVAVRYSGATAADFLLGYASRDITRWEVFVPLRSLSYEIETLKRQLEVASEQSCPPPIHCATPTDFRGLYNEIGDLRRQIKAPSGLVRLLPIHRATADFQCRDCGDPILNAKLIKTESDYEAALARLDVIFEAEPGTPEGDEAELLTALIEMYEEKAYPMGMPTPQNGLCRNCEALIESRDSRLTPPEK